MVNKSIPAPEEAAPLHVFLKRRVEEIGDLTNVRLAELLGYERPNVVAMILNGTMKLPIAKVPQLAQALGLDPVALLKRVLLAYDPSLWTVFEEVLGNKLTTNHERQLLEFTRRHLGGVDLDFTGDPALVSKLAGLLAEALDAHTRAELAERTPDRVPRESAAARQNRAMLELLDRQAAERQALRRSFKRGG